MPTPRRTGVGAGWWNGWVDLCSCGKPATASCARCAAHLCDSHALSSRTVAAGAIDEFLTRNEGTAPEQDEQVLCADCRAESVAEDLAELAEYLEPEDRVRGTAWLLALGIWNETDAAGDTYGAIVCEANGWDTHREVSPLDLALACLEEFGPELDPPSLKVIMRWHTPPQKTLFRVVESELRAVTVGRVDGWMIDYSDDETTHRLLLHARGEAYVPPALTRLDPQSYRYTIGVSTLAEVAAARSRLVTWMSGVRSGDAEPAGELHCDLCTERAAAAIAGIALGTQPQGGSVRP
jgi:hypothetical protein